MRIYIAGPLSSADRAARFVNIQAAVDAGIELYRKGHVPYIPHLTHYVDVRQMELGKGLGYEDWMRVDLHWLGLCDAILYLGSSPGADRELAFAEEEGMTIFRSLEEVPSPKRELWIVG